MARRTRVRELLGRRVYAVRELRGLTQERLAERMEMSAKSISDIERGVVNPRLETLHKLATALGLELWELLRFEEKTATGPAENAAAAFAAHEQIMTYVRGQAPVTLERVVRVIEAMLGDVPPVR